MVEAALISNDDRRQIGAILVESIHLRGWTLRSTHVEHGLRCALGRDEHAQPYVIEISDAEIARTENCPDAIVRMLAKHVGKAETALGHAP